LSGPGLLVALQGAAVGYGRRVLLTGVDLTVRSGDFLAIVGPNGGGKTTLLRALLGVLPPLAGLRVQPAPLAVGYVPQRDQVDAVWPLSAAEVVAMGRARLVRPGRRLQAGDRAVVEGALERAGIAAHAHRPFRELSGGQRQRALIARALAAEPQLLALDEPTNGMDPAGELDVLELLHALNREQGLTVAMISHRLDAVASHATELAFVDHHRGLLRIGSPAQLLTAEALSALYGRPVAVHAEEGRVVVIPGGRGAA
jgi:ABC-type Mn2+/Zn2+ transport system ATPase subunit